MGEIKTQPVRALHFSTLEEFRARKVAGSIHVAGGDEDGEQAFWYTCPCGCGRQAPLVVGNGFKPHEGPSWNWNGSLDSATLHPSVHHQGHWHGWLKNGVWESC
jgi:hypothetical protein